MTNATLDAYETTEAAHNYDYDSVVRAIAIGEPFVVAFGIPSNVGMLVILSKLKEPVGQSVRVYYQAIAFCELVMVLSLCLLVFQLSFLSYYGVPSVRIAAMGAWPCIVLRFTYWTFGAVDLFLYVALAGERLVAIALPLRARACVTRRSAVTVVCSVFGVWGTFMLFAYGLLSRPKPGDDCTPGTYDWSIAVQWLSVYAYVDYIVPTGLSVCLTALLMLLTFRLTLKRKRLLGSTAAASAAASKVLNLKSDLKRAAVVILTCTIHVLYYVPLAATFVVYALINNETAYAANQILHGLSGTVYSTNFFVFFFKISKFRKAFLCR